jgi:hypothetical protein
VLGPVNSHLSRDLSTIDASTDPATMLRDANRPGTRTQLAATEEAKKASREKPPWNRGSTLSESSK